MIKKSTASKTDGVFASRFITLKSVFDKADNKIFTQPCKNKNGQLPPCVKKVTSNGDMILSERERNEYAEGKAVYFPEDHIFEIRHNMTLDLESPHDKAVWECIKNSPLIAKSRDEKDEAGNLVIDGPKFDPHKLNKYGTAEMYVFNPVAESERKVSKAKKRHDAESYILNDPQGVDGRLNMARILGRSMSNQPDADVTDYLLTVASDNPDKIINLYTGDDIHLRLTFIDAKEKHVIYIKNKLFMYGDSIVLGATDDAVIGWMRDPRNLKILELIRKDTYPDYIMKTEG
ncbi:MAG: hypothetical protein LUC37_02230 [Prevotella sp.]|nr:hypothetical protein [Prevotella sp.]